MSDERPTTRRYGEEVEEYRRMVESTRSFTSPAIITLVLYFVLWIPGIIANLVFWNEARSIKARTGRAPDGMGCLTAMLVVLGIGVGVIGLFFVFAVLAA